MLENIYKGTVPEYTARARVCYALCITGGIIYCTLHTVHCTLYTVHRTPYYVTLTAIACKVGHILNNSFNLGISCILMHSRSPGCSSWGQQLSAVVVGVVGCSSCGQQLRAVVAGSSYGQQLWAILNDQYYVYIFIDYIPSHFFEIYPSHY